MHHRWLVVAILVLGLSAVQAQVDSGKVVGTVRDVTGAVVSGATVTVSNTATNATRETRTDDNGSYVVTELKPGIYTVVVGREGFKKAVQEPFKLDINQVVGVDVALVVGSAVESIQVTAAEPLIESQTSSLGQVLEEDRVAALPLNGRDFIQLAYLVPGVNAGPQGGSTVPQQGGIPENERASGAIQVNGLTATNNNFLLNGLDNNEQQIGFEVIQPSVDAIQEFKVQTNGFAADIGKGGAVVNIILKSGSNQFHGSAFEFLRNSALDAKNFFDSPAFKIPPFKRNQFGGTFGGPIVKNKTFFFVDYEGTRIRESQTDLSIVPLPSERGGDFSNSSQLIYDPVTVGGNPRQQFPSNVIPANRLDPAALKIVQLFPAPNRNVSGDANNFLLNPVLKNNQNSFDVRVDHQLSAKNNLSSFFSWGNVDSERPDPLPGLAGGGGFSGHVRNLARAVGLTDVHAFSSNKINEFGIGYSRYVVDAVQNFAGQDVATQVGIPGVNDPNNLLATGGLTAINIAGFSSLGNQCCFPEFLRENNYQVMDSFTYIRGKHSFKVGAELKRRQHGFLQALNPQGQMNFDAQFTAVTPSDQNTGNALASFLLGYPISSVRDGQKNVYGMSWWEFSSYLMDDVRVTPKLTLNLGLRYDLFTPMVEDHDRLANFDFSTGLFVSPPTRTASRSGNVVTDRNNFAPRFGFAWTPLDSKTVLRGGFGIYYSLQANQNDTELAYNPTGLFFSQSVNNPGSSPGTRISDGFPTPQFPTIANPSGRTSAALFNNRTTYIEEWNLNMEREIAKSMALQLAYVGTHGVKLAHLINLNQPVLPSDNNFCGLDLNNCNDPNFNRPYDSTVPNVAAIRTEAHNYSSVAHALQARFEKRFSSGWSMLNSYTWQHSIGQTEENEFFEPQDTHNLKAERGDNGPDYRHQFTSAWSYELPLGPGKRFLNIQGPVHWLAGGWQLNGIVALYSGQAFTPLLSFDPTNTGSGAPRPDQIGNPFDFANATSFGCPSNHQSIQCWYNPTAFAVPGLAPGQTFAARFGNARRGSLRGPAQHNVDFSVFKDFKFKESRDLQFRAEFFNLFNTPQFGLPAQAVDTPSAGSISSTVQTSRQVQLALKFTF